MEEHVSPIGSQLEIHCEENERKGQQEAKEGPRNGQDQPKMALYQPSWDQVRPR